MYHISSIDDNYYKAAWHQAESVGKCMQQLKPPDDTLLQYCIKSRIYANNW